MSQLKIIIADAPKSPAWKAWRQVLPLFLNGLVKEENILHHDKAIANGKGREECRIGLALTFEPDARDFWDRFVDLERAVCEFYIHVTSQKENEYAKPWIELEPRWRGICAQRCTAVEPHAVSLAEEIQKRFKEANKDFALHLRPCRHVADAKELVRGNLLPEFSHGGAADVTNIMLGPVRMLCKVERNPDRTEAWKSWIKMSATTRADACQKLEQARAKLDGNGKAEKRLTPKSPHYNELAAQLFDSWDKLKDWLEGTREPDTADSENKIRELERMMSLLTDIRSIAKGKPGTTAGSTGVPRELKPAEVGPSGCDTIYRILVVDDHASCWSSIVCLAAKRFSAEKSVKIEIDYSIDAKTIIGRGDLDRFILRYDLVLQDVYLPGESGIEVLKKLRERVRWLPVIVWTSSLSSELAGSAVLHNGYLFKKTSTIQDLESVFAKWLPVGNARRNYSLLNPLFDHAIVTPERRKVAVEFTLWCLKLLDGFHAVDDSYFRFFNDHGGRHIVALLEKIEQLLRPLLLREQLNAENNSESLVDFGEEELLGLYIAVLCHEFGMFPLGTVGFEKHTHSGLELARKQHALTSFLALADPDDPDADLDGELRVLIRGLRRIAPKSHSLAALISAYHSRVLSLDRTKFTQLKQDSSGEAKIRQLKMDFNKIRRLLTCTAWALPLPNRRAARQLSAIFRFADAIEIDSSRVPAPFLLEAAGRADTQNREDLKRQVVSKVLVEDGEVSIHFNCSVCSADEGVVWPWENPSRWSISRPMKIVEVFAFLRERFTCYKENEYSKAAKLIKAHLDDWLDTPPGVRSKKALAFIAALSVICDVVEEYDAIKKAGQELNASICLGQAQWREASDLAQMSLLNVVMERQKRLLETNHNKAIELYEFKFVFQSRQFAQDLLKLIGRNESFDNYAVVSRSRQTIKDVYYDAWLDEDGQCFELASKGISCRWRIADNVNAFQIKQPQSTSGDYLKFTTRSFPDRFIPVLAWDDYGRPTDVPDEVRRQFEIRSSKSLLPVASIENERCTLVVVGKSSDKWAKLNLDTFQVTDGRGEPLEECEEIEIVSPDASVVADISEILAASFKLFKTQRSRIERFSQTLFLSPQGRRRELLWLDVDTGVDDAMGLLLALRSPKRCEVAGVSTVGGNVSLEQVLTNTAKIVAYSGVSHKPPLFKGFAPLGAQPNASNVHGEKGIGEIDGFVPNFEMPEWADLTGGFERVVQQYEKRQITFVATGPLTNLAKLTQDCPEAVKQLKAIVIMGGAFDEPGNRTAKAEFNIHSDPESARIVLAFCQLHGLRHSFVPLDITHRVVLHRKTVRDLSLKGNLDAQFIEALTYHYMRFYDQNQAIDGCPLHDPMAVGYVLWPELFTSDTYHVEISPSGLSAFSGVTSADFRPTRLFRRRSNESTGVVLRVNRESFLKHFEEALFKG